MIHPHGPYQWIGAVSTASTAASFVCNVLPNAKYLDAYPRLQRFYGTVINFAAALALNLRHCLPSLDIPAPALGITKPSGTVESESNKEI